MIGAILAGAYGDVAPTGDFESIATVTASGSTGTITFSSIPSSFQHLQVRFIVRDNNTSTDNGINVRVGNGSIDSGSNYAFHRLRGNGASASADAGTSQTAGNMVGTSANATADSYSVGVIDFLDYASTNKNKTFRNLQGYDLNGSGSVWFISGLWMNSASAINTIEFSLGGGKLFTNRTQFALYGIKG
jgi:hypothetical protein